MGRAGVGYSWECIRGTLSPGWAPEIGEVEKSHVIKRKVKMVAGARCALTHIHVTDAFQLQILST